MSGSEGVPAITLARALDRVTAAIDGRPPVPVRLVWARPITGRGQDIALLDDQKTCLAMVGGLAVFAPASRAIAEEELGRRYCIAAITSVHAVRVEFGNRYWDVETDRGRRRFLLREPGKNLTRVSEDHVLIRDTLGNRYVIASLAALDPRSRIEAIRAL
ncbi:MAG: DUF1854 domain-containing protein [Planctomycetes bacterium]|nr:DUF1854 domain-containing protein [Planctomycetota bacterium]